MKKRKHKAVSLLGNGPKRHLVYAIMERAIANGGVFEGFQIEGGHLGVCLKYDLWKRFSSQLKDKVWDKAQNKVSANPPDYKSPLHQQIRKQAFKGVGK